MKSINEIINKELASLRRQFSDLESDYKNKSSKLAKMVTEQSERPSNAPHILQEAERLEKIRIQMSVISNEITKHEFYLKKIKEQTC